MSGVSMRARGIARAVACITMGLTATAGAVASGPESDSTASRMLGTVSLEAKSWGGIGSVGGGFRVTPTRVVFDGRLRSAELTLVNTGAEPATYRVSLARMRMSEDGGITEVAEPLPDERFADSLVRFSPRQVELEPGVAQTVRVQLRKPANLADGEYRSHLVFRALPPVESEDGADTRNGRSGGVSIALRPVFGAAIPVIVRQGATAATVKIEGLQLRRPRNAEGAPVLTFVMRRTGNQSAYGDLMVTSTPQGGRPRSVGGMRGLAVYTPNLVRRVTVPLRVDANDPLTAETLRVTYEEVAAEHELLAEAELALP